ncbi:MAG: type II secretion system protein [Planctomycetota bacterium]|nr:MAG: type II secretion system protein [Planctomycetota bacterium]
MIFFKQTLKPNSQRSGFTLLEILVVMAILAVILGAALPMGSKWITSQAKRDTQTELRQHGVAVENYFRDTLELPSSLKDLIQPPKGISGWSGPYLTGDVASASQTSTGFEVDAWRRPYRLSQSGDQLVILSDGPDAVRSNGDDLRVTVDVTWIRRELTLERLEILNDAVLRYNSIYGKDQPLTPGFSRIFTVLVTRKILPNSSELQEDAWGDAFVEDPLGRSPVVKLTSVHLGRTSGSQGVGGSSSKKGGQGQKGSKQGKGGGVPRRRPK